MNPSEADLDWHLLLERTFTQVLRFGVLLPPVFTILSRQDFAKFPSVYATFLATEFCILVIAVVRTIPFHVRVAGVLLAVYVLGVLEALTFGYSAESFIFFMITVVGAGLLIGRKGAWITWLVSLTTLAAIGWQISQGSFTPLAISRDSVSSSQSLRAIPTLILFAAGAAGLSIVFTKMWEGWQLAWQRERQALDLLQQEHDLLEQRVKERSQDLAESEAKYRTLVEQLPVVVYRDVADETGRSIYISPQVETMLGYSLTDWVQDQGFWWKIIHPEDHEHLIATIRKTIELGFATDEYRIFTREGHTLWMRDEAILVRDRDGMPQFIQGTMQDITQRKQAEEKFQQLLESAPDAMLILDRSGRVRLVNTQMEALFGYRRDEIIGQTVEMFLPERFRNGHLEHREDYFRQPKTRPMGMGSELYARRKDGGEFPVEISLSPTKDSEELVAIATIRDITQRKQMEEALRTSEEQFRALFEHAPIGIGVADVRGNLVAFNDAMLQSGGFSREDIYKIGNVAALYYDSQKRDEALGLFQKQGFLKDFEVQFKRKDGTPYDTLLSLTRITFNGQPCIQAMVEDISERKQAEQALRDSEKRFRSLIEHGADQVSLLAPDGRLLYENPTTVRPLGYPMGAFLGRNLFELVHPDDLERARRTWGEMLGQPGSSKQAAFRLRHANDSWLWVEGTATNLLHDPTVQAVVINYRDITERKYVEQALRESEERYRLITQNAEDIIWTTDMQLRLTYVSPSLERSLGYSAQELIALPPNQLLTPESLTRGLQALAEEVTAFQPRPDPNYARVLELEYRRKDGSTFWVEMKFNFFRDVAGQPTGILGVGRDVTLRKQAEEHVAQMNAELEQRVAERTADLERANQLLTSLGQAAIATTKSLDLDRVLDEILQYARKIVPYQGANVMFVEGEFAYVSRHMGYEGRPVRENLLNMRFPLSWPSLQHMLTTGKSIYVPNTAQFSGWRSSSSLERPHSYVGIPLKAGLETIGFLNASSDRPNGFQPEDVQKLEALSAYVVNALQNARLLKQLETALQQEQTMRAQLVHADKLAALGKMVAVIAHEINNPIQTIKNSFFLLSDQVEAGSKAEAVLKIAEAEANRIADLIAQLRDAYRPRSATFTLVNLIALLEEVEMILTPQMKRSRVSWSHPVEAKPYRVFAVRNSLKQVFINLALNAIEAMEADNGGKIMIRLVVGPDSKQIGVAVHNTGPMIPEDILPKIFDPFFTTKGTGGTGLGLSISYDIIQQHQGKITVENNPDKGVTFTVWLPLAPEAE